MSLWPIIEYASRLAAKVLPLCKIFHNGNSRIGRTIVNSKALEAYAWLDEHCAAARGRIGTDALVASLARQRQLERKVEALEAALNGQTGAPSGKIVNISKMKGGER